MSYPESTSVATVFYGGVSVLEKTLPTWLDFFGPLGVSFSFVDNTESDEVRSLLLKLGFFDSPKTTYSKSDENIGFASGANRAISNSSTSRILLLNPDTYVDKTSAENIISERITENFPFIAFGLSTSGAIHTGITLTKFGFFKDSTNTFDLLIGPSGGAMMFNKEIFLNLGGFAGQLFAWGEDAELALRLYTQKIKTRRSKVVIPHIGGHTVASEVGANLKTRLINRNRVLILRASYSMPAQIVWLPLMLAAIFANMFSSAKKRKTIRYALEGVRAGLTEPITFAWKKRQRLPIGAVTKMCLGKRHGE